MPASRRSPTNRAVRSTERIRAVMHDTARIMKLSYSVRQGAAALCHFVSRSLPWAVAERRGLDAPIGGAQRRQTSGIIREL